MHYFLPLVKSKGTTRLLRSHFSAGRRAKQFHHGLRKKAFFNGKKWEAGEELAVAARIIDGNCLAMRLRFMNGTTHEGWRAV